MTSFEQTTSASTRGGKNAVFRMRSCSLLGLENVPAPSLWTRKAFQIIRAQGGEDVLDLVANFSHISAPDRSTEERDSRRITNLERDVCEWRLKCSVANAELRKSEAKCQLLQRELNEHMLVRAQASASVNLKPGSNSKSNTRKEFGIKERSKSEVLRPDSDRLDELTTLYKAMQRELIYRDQVLGVTSWNKTHDCKRRYNTELTRLKDAGRKADQELAELREANWKLRTEMVCKESALRFSELSWKVIYTELGDLFRKLRPGMCACDTVSRNSSLSHSSLILLAPLLTPR